MSISNDFLTESCLIDYNEEIYEKGSFPPDRNLDVSNNHKTVNWLNVYGFGWKEQIKQIIKVNKLDDFLNILVLEEDQKNKMIDLEDAIYLTVNVLICEKDDFKYDRIKFYFLMAILW